MVKTKLNVCILLVLVSIGDFVDAFLPTTTRPADYVSARATTTTTTRRFATAAVEKTDEEWKEELTPEQFYVLREEGTEAPNSSELNFVKESGSFTCAGCGSPLFVTSTKFDSGTGWPSFYAPIDNSAIALSTDFKLILPRTECSCSTCGGHLGHVFDDGPDPTGQRFCMNGVAMKFTSDDASPELAATVSERQQADLYRPRWSDVVPSVMINGIMGGLFFNAFITAMERGPSSPLDGLPLLPAMYFGIMAVRSCARLSSEN